MMCGCVYIYQGSLVEVRGRLSGVDSLFLLYVGSGDQIQVARLAQQVYLPFEPSLQPLIKKIYI